MEEITYNDVLVHYENMMTDITDELQRLKDKLEKISVYSQQVWKGNAGEACFDKTQELCEDIRNQLVTAEELTEMFRQARVNYDILFPSLHGTETEITEE